MNTLWARMQLRRKASRFPPQSGRSSFRIGRIHVHYSTRMLGAAVFSSPRRDFLLSATREDKLEGKKERQQKDEPFAEEVVLKGRRMS